MQIYCQYSIPNEVLAIRLIHDLASSWFFTWDTCCTGGTHYPNCVMMWCVLSSECGAAVVDSRYASHGSCVRLHGLCGHLLQQCVPNMSGEDGRVWRWFKSTHRTRRHIHRFSAQSIPPSFLPSFLHSCQLPSSLGFIPFNAPHFHLQAHSFHMPLSFFDFFHIKTSKMSNFRKWRHFNGHLFL